MGRPPQGPKLPSRFSLQTANKMLANKTVGPGNECACHRRKLYDESEGLARKIPIVPLVLACGCATPLLLAMLTHDPAANHDGDQCQDGDPITDGGVLNHPQHAYG